MAAILLVSTLHVFILMSLTLILTIILGIQLLVGLCNIVMNWNVKDLSTHPLVLNLYLHHHLIVCIVRCGSIFLTCFFITILHECLYIEIFIHLLLLLSTFDLLLIIVGETAHFWDSTIKHKSTLHSKCCLTFGIVLNYCVSALFLAIHLTMNGENPIIIDICRITKRRDLLPRNSKDERSLIPTLILYVLFILLDLLTCAWIYLSYRDVSKLKRKGLASVFFSTLVFTNFKEGERKKMVNHSLKRLLTIYSFVISNILTILPILTIKVFDISLNNFYRLCLIYLTTLPWLDCLTFLFYDETKLNGINFVSKKTIFNRFYHHQRRVGERLSSYRETRNPMRTVDEK